MQQPPKRTNEPIYEIERSDDKPIKAAAASEIADVLALREDVRGVWVATENSGTRREAHRVQFVLDQNGDIDYAGVLAGLQTTGLRLAVNKHASDRNIDVIPPEISHRFGWNVDSNPYVTLTYTAK